VTGSAVRIAVTGTPGTGKSTATDRLEGGVGAGAGAGADAGADANINVIHLNDVIKNDPTLWTDRDATRDTLTADLAAVSAHLGEWTGVLDSHLAHHFAVDRVVVLRCHPASITTRLDARGESPASIEENAEAEALDVILTEAVTNHGRENVYEFDTTDRDPAAVAEFIRAVIADEATPRAGTVDFTGYL